MFGPHSGAAVLERLYVLGASPTAERLAVYSTVVHEPGYVSIYFFNPNRVLCTDRCKSMPIHTAVKTKTSQARDPCYYNQVNSSPFHKTKLLSIPPTLARVEPSIPLCKTKPKNFRSFDTETELNLDPRVTTKSTSIYVYT